MLCRRRRNGHIARGADCSNSRMAQATVSRRRVATFGARLVHRASGAARLLIVRRDGAAAGSRCRDRRRGLLDRLEGVVLEEVHDAANPGVRVCGAAGEGEVVSLDWRMELVEVQPFG